MEEQFIIIIIWKDCRYDPLEEVAKTYSTMDELLDGLYDLLNRDSHIKIVR